MGKVGVVKSVGLEQIELRKRPPALKPGLRYLSIDWDPGGLPPYAPASHEELRFPGTSQMGEEMLASGYTQLKILRVNQGRQWDSNETAESTTWDRCWVPQGAITGPPTSLQWIGSCVALHSLQLASISFERGLPEWITCLESLRELYLEKCEGLEHLPPWMGSLTKLQRLRIMNSAGLKEWPESMQALTELQVLHFSHARLPDWIGTLSGLLELGVEGFQGDLPRSIGSLHRLRVLDIVGSRTLATLPEEIQFLSCLRVLSISHCQAIEELPSCMQFLTRLRTLDLAISTRLRIVPEWIGCFSLLESFSLQDCSMINMLPASMTQLTGLSFLDLSGTRLQYLPEWVGVFTQLLELHLSDLPYLTILPQSMSAIGSLTQLKELKLSGCSGLERLPAAIGGLVCLTTLNLAGCSGLRELPEEVGSLTLVTVLCLSGCSGLVRLPAAIGGLVCLQKLLLRGCSGLRELPEEVGSLTQLKELELSGCSGLERLPAAIGGLARLQKLSVFSCSGLRELPEEVGSLTQLKELELRGCSGLERLPAAIGGLVCLQKLDLHGCSGLRELPEDVWSLTQLEELWLRGCSGLERLPAAIGGLVCLRALLLRGCSGLRELPEEVGSLTQLKELELSGCSGLERLPAAIGGLARLQKLSVFSCSGLRELPEDVGSLTQLEELWLRGCSGLERLPAAIGGLVCLRTLDLDGCSGLRALPEEVGLLTNLTALDMTDCHGFADNPLSLGSMHWLRSLHVPFPRRLPSWIRKSVSSVVQYLSDLRGERIVCKLQKVMVVGPERAGKSSLVDSLRAGRGRLRDYHERTVGIDLVRWMPDQASELVVNVYDAGGQHIYETTHCLFLAEDTLFVCVLKACQSDHDVEAAADSVLRWLEGLQQHVTRPCVLIVVTHVDLETETDVEGGTVGAMERILGRISEQLVYVAAACDDALGVEEKEVLREIFGDDMPWRADLRERDQRLAEFNNLVCRNVNDIVPAVRNFGPDGLATLASRLTCIRHAMALCDSITSSLQVLDNRVQDRLQAQSVPLSEGELESLPSSVEFESGHRSSLLKRWKKVSRLQEQCLQQPLVLACVGVSSSSSNHSGIEEFRKMLVHASKQVFPNIHTGNVPTTFAILDRLFLQGRRNLEVDGATDGNGDGIMDMQRFTGWELSLDGLIAGMASERLKQLCQKPILRLRELQQEAQKCGIEPDVLDRALNFLHRTGSVLYYPQKPLNDFVFLQPQWIIDALKYVIREREETSLSDELRQLDKKIEEEGFEEELKEFKRNGELCDRLLKHCLWRIPTYAQPHPRAGQEKFPSDHRALLVDLMKSFNLLIPIHDRQQKTYLVPCLLHEDLEVPYTFRGPEWWSPEACSGAAACMRRVFVTRRLPFGFLSELQVRMSQSLGGNVKHTAGGSVLKTNSAGVEETVVASVSRESHAEWIRVVGWVKVLDPEAAEEEPAAPQTEWSLFNGVVAAIETAAACRLGIIFVEKVPITDDTGALAGLVSASKLRRDRSQIIEVEVGGRTLRKARAELFPEQMSLKRAAPQALLAPSESSPETSPSSTARPPKILACFCKEKRDGIGVHQEGQSLYTLFDKTEGLPAPIIHPQPTFEDFLRDVMLAKEKGVTVVHFSGHGKETEGVFFLGDEAGEMSESVNEIFCQTLVSKSSTKGGTIECGVLNACSTEALGKRLWEGGVSNVICWQEKVADAVALKFSKRFYQSLALQYSEIRDEASRSGGASQRKICYRTAFDAGLEGAILQVKRSAESTAAVPESAGDRGRNGCVNSAPDTPVFFGPNGRYRPTRPVAPPPPPPPPQVVQAGSAAWYMLRYRLLCTCVHNYGRGRLFWAMVAVPLFSWTWLRSLRRRRWLRRWWIVAMATSFAAWLWRVMASIRTQRASGALGRDDAEGGTCPFDSVGLERDNRMATNSRGDLELRAFEALGVKLEYKGRSIRASIRQYQNNKLKGSQMPLLGLEEDTKDDPKTPGKKHLRLTREALRYMFQMDNLRGYTGLFGSQGAVVRWAEMERGDVRAAFQLLRESLGEREREQRRRGGRGCPLHDFMIEVLRECVATLGQLVVERERARNTDTSVDSAVVAMSALSTS